ncbi:C40 family peptidase [Pararobbsia silviterrae]|uniref:Peptidase P60 n=1 Tax=Pararobbsia silviterrae TaxID=1792498 RepID=A0A494X0H0_9BURK|nr:C40 family peptidase [Pararobbsia silviterrae]RKP43792.1 peptidase P60 [Pararobbsia silviterrae]
MEQTTVDAIRAHAESEYPKECCGLVVVARGRERYVPCRNAADTPEDHFVIPAEAFADAEDLGDVLAVVHSHPDTSSKPSQADRVACEASGLEWHIVAWPGGDIYSFAPSGYEAPLVGRRFSHGVLDCWTLVRDWYARERGVVLDDIERKDLWWNDGKSDLYRDNFAARGGVVVPDGEPLQVGDVILMEIRSRNGVPNHAAVFIGDGKILHHCYRQLSTRDVYGGYWAACTRMVLRYVPK